MKGARTDGTSRKTTAASRQLTACEYPSASETNALVRGRLAGRERGEDPGADLKGEVQGKAGEQKLAEAQESSGHSGPKARGDRERDAEQVERRDWDEQPQVAHLQSPSSAAPSSN